MANQRIDQLTAETTPAAADVLPIFSIAGSDTKKITVKNLVQQGAALVDDASIPVAKVNLSGISGTNLTNGTVTAAKFDTSTIPATGGVTVSSSNLQLVAPTSPIVRNAGTGSLEHATSGVTAGTYTKLTVDTRGHVTAGTSVAAADLPIAVSGTVGVMSPGTGLTVTGGGVLNHSSSITAGTTSGFTYDAQGHITGTVALAGADLPIATSSVRGAVRPGTGLSVDGNGILAVTAATNAALGGVIAGSDFAVSTGTISLAAQAGIAAGQYTKVTINSKGIATAGTVLSAGDIPNLAASQITSGSLDIARIGANTITGAKVANYAVTKIGDTQPTADYIGQFFFNPLSRDLSLFDGNVFQPIGISVGEIVFAGTFDASAGGGTGHVASVTAEGTGIGLVEGSPLPAAATANNRYYLVVSEGGTITSGNAPQVALAPPDIVLSTGIEWTEVDVSQTFTSVSASQVAFTPEGTIASNNVQAAIEEVNNEKLSLAGGTVTGNLEIGTAGSLSFEGSTANAFETTIAVVDPTADRTITLPNVTGTVVTTGDTGTVTSTMLLDGTILNADINASAAIDDTKLATIATALKVSNSATTATSANTASAIVARDASGNFTAGTITGTFSGTTFVGTTSLALNRSSANQGLTGISSVALPGATSGTVTVQPAAIAGTTTITLPATTGTVITTGDSGTVTSTMLLDGTILNADINASAGIVDTKLATIATAGKVSNSATTAASANTASAIVARDASGNFTAGTITAALTGTASGNLVSGGALGTPSSGTLTSCTGLPISTGVSGLGTGAATFLATPSSANFAALLTDETGTGSNVFATSPTLVTPVIGAATGTSLSVTGAAGLLTRAAATQDGVELIGRAGGTTSLKATITPTTLTANRTFTLPDATTTLAGLGVVQSFTVAQRGAITALTDGATITADFAAANNFSVTLGGSRTLANPSNQTAGQSGCIWITQDGTGSRTLAYGSQWDFTGGTAPTLSTAAGAVDCLVYAVQSSTKITATLISNLS